MKTKITKTDLTPCQHRYDLRKCEDNSIIRSVFAFSLSEARKKLKANQA